MESLTELNISISAIPGSTSNVALTARTIAEPFTVKLVHHILRKCLPTLLDCEQLALSPPAPHMVINGHPGSRNTKDKSSWRKQSSNAVLLIADMHHRQSTTSPDLTEDALASLAEEEKSQLQAWCEEHHAHEQLAVGERTCRAGKEIEEFFEDIEKSVDGQS